jgi:hypothetical protein
VVAAYPQAAKARRVLKAADTGQENDAQEFLKNQAIVTMGAAIF